MAYTALIIKGESISITLNGATTVIPSDAPNFEPLCALVRKQASDKDVKAILTPAAQIKTVGAAAGFEVRINETTNVVGVFYEGKEINSKVSAMIVKSYMGGQDFLALRNFMLKALSNRDASEVDVLYDFVTKNNLPIHPDGDFLAFKATRADGYDKHSGTVQYRIGEYLHVKNANQDKRTQCGTGLHIGGRDYVKNYGSQGSDAFWIIKVNPADAIFYHADASDGKMRVSKLFVYARTFASALPEAFIAFVVATSPEGDVLEASAKKNRVGKTVSGGSAKVVKQGAKGHTKPEKKAVKVAKKEQSFVAKTPKGLTFTSRAGKSYDARVIESGVTAHGQRGYAAISGIPRATLQGWLAIILAETVKTK
jgi:hypothetical protein